MRPSILLKVAVHWFVQTAVFVFILWAQSPVCAQTLETKLDQSKTFNSKSTTLRGQLVDVAQTFGIPMGLELIADNEKPLPPIHFKNATVLTVLSKILKQQPGYEFDLSDGVVSVYSTQLFNDHRNFLNVTLRSYRIRELNIFGAGHVLQICIKQNLHPDRNYGGGFGGVQGNSLDIAELTFSGDYLTVRQTLNRLVALHGGALWMVHLNPTKKMRDEPFYAQVFPGTDVSSPEFYWQFVPLR